MDGSRRLRQSCIALVAVSVAIPVLRDSDFLADAARLRIDITPQAGEDIQRMVDNAYASPRNVVDRLKTIVNP